MSICETARAAQKKVLHVKAGNLTLVAVDEVQAGEEHAVSTREKQRLDQLIAELAVLDRIELREQHCAELLRMGLLLDRHVDRMSAGTSIGEKAKQQRAPGQANVDHSGSIADICILISGASSISSAGYNHSRRERNTSCTAKTMHRILPKYVPHW